MNGRYALAKTPEERIAIAISGANREFARLFPAERFPPPEYYAAFLEPFLQREIRQAQLEELHLQTSGPIRRREREIVDALKHWSRVCEEKLKQK